MLVTYQNYTNMHRPKNIKFWLEHVGEKIVSKYIINTEVHFVGYLCVMDMINLCSANVENMVSS
jgi:hypothetical protein